MFQHFDTFDELTRTFRDEKTCIRHFRAIRWAKGAFCPYCDSMKIYNFSDDRTHKCGECRQKFSIKVGTIFEDTKLPLRKWFIAIWLLTSRKKGIASTQLARDIGVTQKTAWFMLHRLRHAAQTQSFNKPLAGIVEVDETFVGGKARNRHLGKRGGPGRGGLGSGKVPVIGAVERKGDVVARSTESVDAATLKGFVRENVSLQATLLVTDQWVGYRGLAAEYPHRVINHAKGECVKGPAHTNTIEGFWSLFKRQVYGIHHWISPKHLDRYVNEATWRYNRREAEEGDRVNALLCSDRGQTAHLSGINRMKTKKPKSSTELNMNFGEALARFMQTDPKEVVEAVAGGILKQRADAERRIAQVRKELEDGARPRKGRFRL